MTTPNTLLPCEHCQCRYGSHFDFCPTHIDDIVSKITSGFKDDVAMIMATNPKSNPGDMTTEQQCAMIAEASGWRTRALKAEAERDAAVAKVAALQIENARLRQAIADEANRVNIEGSEYHRAQLALDEIVTGLKRRSRAALVQP